MRRSALVVRGGWEGHVPVQATELFLPFLAGPFGVFLTRQFFLGLPDELIALSVILVPNDHELEVLEGGMPRFLAVRERPHRKERGGCALPRVDVAPPERAQPGERQSKHSRVTGQIASISRDPMLGSGSRRA